MDDSCISIHNLNNDCLLHIFSFISICDRNKIESVSRRWQAVCSLLWRMTRVFDVRNMQTEYKSHQGKTTSDIGRTTCEQVFLKCFPYLTEVNLSRSTVNFHGAKFINSGHSCNIDLNTRRPKKLRSTLNSLKDPFSNCENLENLSICYCVLDVDDEFLMNLFEKNRKLRSISLSKYKLTGKCLSHLPLDTLESIELYRCLVDNDLEISFVSNAIKLHTVSVINHISRCKFANGILPVSSGLIRLNLTDYEITQKLAFDICKCKHLTFLALREADLDDHTLILLIDNCKDLTVLDISYIESLTDVSLCKTSSLLHLRCLGIGFNWNFTNDGLSTLSDDLRMLDLSATTFSSDTILTTLERNQSLEKLDLAFIQDLDMNFVISVISIVRLRANNVPLEIGIFGSSIDIEKIHTTCPQVKFCNDSIRLSYHMYA